MIKNLSLFINDLKVDKNEATNLYTVWKNNIKESMNTETDDSMKLISIMKSSYNITHIQELALLMNIYKNINELDLDKLEKSFKRWVKSLQQDETNNAFKIYCIDTKGDFKCLRKNSNVKDRVIYSFYINKNSEYESLSNELMQIQESIIKFIRSYIN